MRLMIGYGNPLRCDDGIGPYLAETLGEGWTVLTPTQLTPELAEPISRAQYVVFFDARVSDRPGEVACRHIKPRPAGGAFSHNVTPASLLSAAGELYDSVPQALLITVTGASFGYGDTLSPFIAERLTEMVRTAAVLVQGFVGTTQTAASDA